MSTPAHRGAAPPAVVLGLGVNGYGLVRSLAREGVSVVGSYWRAEDFGRYSRHCARAHRLNDSPGAGDAFCRALMTLRRDLREDPVLFPTEDGAISLLSRRREELGRHFRFHWAPAAQMDVIVDKAAMSAVCLEAGVLTPRTHVTRAGEDLRDSAARFPFPCVVKPSRSFQTTFPGKAFVARTREELLAFYATHPGLPGATIWQEVIEGGDDQIFQCTVLARRSGEIAPVFCARKLRQYPPGYGIMCFGRSEENPAVVAEALRLVRVLRYEGLASLEFKRRPADGRYYFIEMNARLPWYNTLFTDAGVNLAYAAYLDLTDPERLDRMKMEQRDGVHWVSLEENLGWYARSRRRERLGLGAWGALLRARSFAWWSLTDPLPGLRAAARLLGLALRRSGS